MEVGLVKELVFRQELDTIGDSEHAKKLPINIYNRNYDIHNSFKIYNRIDEYVKMNIKDLYGITLSEFLSMSQTDALMLITHAPNGIKHKNHSLTNVMNDLNKEI